MQHRTCLAEFLMLCLRLHMISPDQSFWQFTIHPCHNKALVLVCYMTCQFQVTSVQEILKSSFLPPGNKTFEEKIIECFISFPSHTTASTSALVQVNFSNYQRNVFHSDWSKVYVSTSAFTVLQKGRRYCCIIALGLAQAV